MGNYGDVADVLNLCDFPTLTGNRHWLGQTIYKLPREERPDPHVPPASPTAPPSTADASGTPVGPDQGGYWLASGPPGTAGDGPSPSRWKNGVTKPNSGTAGDSEGPSSRA